ncbi:MAG: phosphoribosylglycinamide formyltransferase [Litoricola sp.]|jgi:phosphoribosylglycinamide formyltransferase-1|nr:phosphoribosylglycinamide formyltransferase [Litorivicinus sp.]MBT6288135.1 phosphoribosylglycinamide formyltransferase [Oceanospirillales bacterium]MCH1501368.1 phosphoribosylglycinamide formyltransferase [Litorivicinaceae bacterium]MDA0893395.1 phosphoribosylglycinamide formyltransferase [Pseudomonadota bacterium]HAB68227.1 phosphoribosylglycinamide formyltransferase [Gammaproteobacteria bacterium]
MRVVCLISGGGTNLQALIDWQTKGLLGDAMIVGVISNVASAYGLERAKRASIPTSVLSHRDYADRLLFDQALRSLIDGYDPDLVVLAGFMRILTAEFVTHYHRRLINIHPSLLPKYKGLDTHRRALDAGDTVAGATVHWVTEALDAGDIIQQVEVPIVADDSEERLKARVLEAEHTLYPSVIRDLSLGVISC